MTSDPSGKATARGLGDRPVVWTSGRLNETAEALRQSLANQAFHVDDRMARSRGIRNLP